MRHLTLVVLTAAALGAAGSSATAEPLKLRVGWSVAPAQLTPLLLEPGVARHHGKSYVLEAQRHAGSSVGLQAMAAGECDIVPMIFTTLGPAVLNAGMSDLRIIADEVRDGVEGHATSEYIVHKESPIQKVEDLKGKTVAINAIGGGQDIYMRVMLRKHGLETPRDYSVVETNFPNMLPMLSDKKADMVVGVIPFLMNPQFRATGRTLFKQNEVMGPTDALFLTARAGFLEKNRAAVVDFMEDRLRAQRWYTDPANKEKATEIIATFLKMPPQQLGWLFTKADYYREPNGLPDPDSIQASLGALKEFGFLKGDIDVKQHMDISLIQEAAARLK
jgi:sulfonate transport system substrate-binding protein